MSTLGASNTSRTALSMPYYGTARADVMLSGGTTAPAVGPAVLTVGDLTLTGGVTIADIDAPDAPHAVWVSGPGWDLPLAKGRSYRAAAGVRLKTVLTDLLADVATACALAGFTPETFAAFPADAPIGTWYARPASTIAVPITGRFVLTGLVRAKLILPWWVAPNGATTLGPRPGGAATARADIGKRNAAAGVRAFGLDSPASFLPGTSLEGVMTSRLIVREASGHLTAEAWA